MTKLHCAIALLFFFFYQTSQACTVFSSPFPGDTRYAHNVDWYEQFPNTKGVLVLNPASLEKQGELFGAKVPAAKWTSRYRSLSFSIAGAEFPVSGFNEKGLRMALLELPETTFPPASDPTPAAGLGQIVQYNLDLSTSIDDVIASTKVIRPYSNLGKMHYFACDATGRCAVIQYINGKAIIYHDPSLPFKALSNSPYPESVAAAQACLADSYKCTPSDDSLFRFANAVRISLQEMRADQPFEDQAFDALGEVAQVGPGTITRFQMVFDPAAQTVQIRKRHNDDVGTLHINFDEADCRKPRKVIPIDEKSSGDLSNKWMVLTEEYQKDMASKMGYPESIATAYGRYPFSVKCVAK